MGDADKLWKLVEFQGVRLICASDGIDSIHEHSRMHFRFKAVFADEFLRDLGKKTRRGQVGAATRDHCTGGLPYGYKSRPVALPDGKEGRLARLPALQAQLRDKAERRVKQYKSQTKRDVSGMERELAKANVNVHRLLTFIQETDEKDPAVLNTVRPALEEAVGKQRSLKATLEVLYEQRPDSRVPTVEEIVGLAEDVKARLADDPIAGRELLRYMLLDGKVTLTPNEDGSYTAASMLIWARVTGKPESPGEAQGLPGLRVLPTRL